MHSKKLDAGCSWQDSVGMYEGMDADATQPQ